MTLLIYIPNWTKSFLMSFSCQQFLTLLGIYLMLQTNLNHLQGILPFFSVYNEEHYGLTVKYSIEAVSRFLSVTDIYNLLGELNG